MAWVVDTCLLVVRNSIVSVSTGMVLPFHIIPAPSSRYCFSVTVLLLQNGRPAHPQKRWSLFPKTARQPRQEGRRSTHKLQ